MHQFGIRNDQVTGKALIISGCVCEEVSGRRQQGPGRLTKGDPLSLMPVGIVQTVVGLNSPRRQREDEFALWA
jgi:hypothetical protein